jgi:thiamine biosynthesis protein ThiI
MDVKSGRRLYLIGLSGELSVKGDATRRRFTERLESNLRAALRGQGIDCRLERRWSRLLLESSSSEAAEAARRVFGVAWVAPAEMRTYAGLDDLLAQGAEIFAPQVAGRSFAVRAKRGDRAGRLPFRSPEVERRLGALLLPGARAVDLETPEVEARLEIEQKRACFFGRRLAGEGGLPVGSEGQALALVSGGFDSVVASWLLLRRGVKLDFFLAGLGGREHRGQVLAILRRLWTDWGAGSRPKLFVADFRPLVAELELAAPAALRQVLLKRQMLRAATIFARRRQAAALLTGEALGQVSSQTLANLARVEEASGLPLLRPLVATGKDEILALARKIGSFEASARVPEHCFLGVKHPSIAAGRKELEAAEAKLDPAIFEAVVRYAEKIDLTVEPPADDAATAGTVEVELPEPGVPLYDLRSPQAFADWHPQGALSLPYPAALQALAAGAFPPLEAVTLLCEIGYKSAHLAELLAARGVRAASLKGGAGPLREKLADPHLLAAVSPALLQGD